MTQHRVLVLCHPLLMPPATMEGYTAKEILDWRTEYDVVKTLTEAGHATHIVGAQEDLTEIVNAIAGWKPTVVFNLLDSFHGQTILCQNVASLLELSRIPYTGCNPRGLFMAQGKDLSKVMLNHHAIPAPEFAVFPMGRKVKRPAALKFPLFVKSLIEDASLGISQASVVETDEKLEERVAFIHERINTDAIAEEYIDGREIYVGVYGVQGRFRALPVWELQFPNLAPGALPIATAHVKHNPSYQERIGLVQGPAKDLSPQVENRIRETAKRICRVLEIDGYARIDFRLAADGTPYFIEANPNPEIAEDEEFAQSALHEGTPYPELLNRLIALAVKRAGLDGDE